MVVLGDSIFKNHQSLLKDVESLNKLFFIELVFSAKVTDNIMIYFIEALSLYGEPPLGRGFENLKE